MVQPLDKKGTGAMGLMQVSTIYNKQ